MPALFGSNAANGVERRTAFGGKPFVSGKPEIIVRIDDGVFALSQRYPAERIAVPDAPIEKHRLDDDPNQPKRDGYSELNLAAPLQCVKFETLNPKQIQNPKLQMFETVRAWA